MERQEVTDNVTKPRLSGGNLIFYLKSHKDEILRHLKKKGLKATLGRYGISQPTLERLIAGGYGESPKLNDSERAFRMAEIALASNAELRRELREMREEYGQLVNLISSQITAAIIRALRNIELELPEEYWHDNLFTHDNQDQQLKIPQRPKIFLKNVTKRY